MDGVPSVESLSAINQYCPRLQRLDFVFCFAPLVGVLQTFLESSSIHTLAVSTHYLEHRILGVQELYQVSKTLRTIIVTNISGTVKRFVYERTGMAASGETIHSDFVLISSEEQKSVV